MWLGEEGYAYLGPAVTVVEQRKGHNSGQCLPRSLLGAGDMAGYQPVPLGQAAAHKVQQV